MRAITKRLSKFKKPLVWFLAIILLWPPVIGRPVQPAAAADGALVEIATNYVNFLRLDNRTINVTDLDLATMATSRRLNVQSIQSGALFQPVATSNPGAIIVQGTIQGNTNVRNLLISGNYRPTGAPEDSVRDLFYYGVEESGIAQIESIENSLVLVGNNIILNGSGISMLANHDGINPLTSPYSVMVGTVPARVIATGPNQVSLSPASGPFEQGAQDITIIYERNFPVVANPITQGGGFKIDAANPTGLPFAYTLRHTSTYQRIVNIVGTIDLSGVRMFPSMGEAGSEVRFYRSTLEAQDIYFVKELNNLDEYVSANKAENFQLYKVTDPGLDDVITVTVPRGLTPGEYYVVFTNPDSQQLGVKARYALINTATQANIKYTVIQAGITPRVLSVYPNWGPAGERTEVLITGEFLFSHNIYGFTPDGALPTFIAAVDNSGNPIIRVDYGVGTLIVGGQSYRVHVTRDVQVMIAGVADIVDWSPQGTGTEPRYDQITAGTPIINPGVRLPADVRVNLSTYIKPDTSATPEFSGDMYKEAVLRNGFVYEADSEAPEVTNIVPTPIPVLEKPGFVGEYYLHPSMGELMIAIEGKNFQVTRYNSGASEIIRYPKIQLGGTEIDLNLSYPWLKNFVILNGNAEVTGITNNEVGNRILLTLQAGPDGYPNDGFPMTSIGRDVVIWNPVRRSSGFSIPFPFTMPYEIFMIIPENDFPNITDVNPNLVDTAGGTQVVITGTNLRTGAQVYIDGKLVPGVTISGDNTRITFNAPPGRAGTTQLSVANPNNGGIATWPFAYTRTYTQPTLISVSPPEGTTNTLVTLKGTNFASPDPSILVDSISNIDELLMYRLIGARVQLGGHDINEYYRVGGRITLQTYMDGIDSRVVENPPFVMDANGFIQMDQNYEGVFFWDAADKKFYVIRRDVRGNFVLDDGYGLQYSITHDGSNFQANSGGASYPINQSTNGRLIFNGITLDAYTPYKIERVSGYDEITGLRVFYRDSSTLNIKIPVMLNSPWTGDGLYDVSVVNPDTRRATKVNGFRYYALGRVVPEVVDVVPAQGTAGGGNVIVLYGPDDNDARTSFTDLGNAKTRVFIGDVEVPPANIQISNGGRQLNLLVPASKENFSALGTDRVTLPIVLVNPDGGSFDVSINRPITFADPNRRTIYGYTYVMPSSHPQIMTILPNTGSSAGNTIVDITGSDFRDFSPFTDLNGNGSWDVGENFTDLIGDGNYYDTAVDAQGNVIDSFINAQGDEVSLRPLLPDIYFGIQKAEIVKFLAPGYIQVKTPPGTGTVNVTVINQDGGVSNSVKYTYVSTNPTITSVLPDSLNKKGGENVDVTGTNFIASTITVMSKDINNNTIFTDREMPLVKAADRTNKNLKKEEDNSGWIKANIAVVDLEGGLKVYYNAAAMQLEIGVTFNNKEYKQTYDWDGTQAVFVDTSGLRANNEDFYRDNSLRIGRELIKVEISADNRLIVDAGYADNATLTSDHTLTFIAPYYYTVGRVPLYVINPGGGQGSSSVEYRNPGSTPIITNIMRDSMNPLPVNLAGEGDVLILRVNYQGGSLIDVIGQQFQEGATIKIGNVVDIPFASIDYKGAEQLSFRMPAVDSRYVGAELYKVYVTNPDGAVAVSAGKLDNNARKSIYIQFTKGETEPGGENINPAQGPAEGGTWVHIKGKDFRYEVPGFDGTIKVYFSGMEAPIVEVIDASNLLVQTPPGRGGQSDVVVENADGERASGIVYTYISNPKINGVYQELADIQVTNLSVTGGEVVRIKGSGFMPGAKIVVGPEVEPAAAGTSGGLLYKAIMKTVTLLSRTLNSNELDPYVLKAGSEASAEYIDDSTLQVVMPPAGLATQGLMIVNPDGGMSNLFTGIEFGLPSVNPPEGVQAEIVRDEVNDRDLYIRVTWTPVNGALAYEIFVIENGQQSLIGTTDQTTFIYTRLQPRTEYTFIVKSIGDYLFSEPSRESNTVRTGRNVGAEVSDAELGAKTTQVKNGNTAQITIGTDDAKQPLVIDLTRGTLVGATEANIILPAKVIYGSAVGNIEVRGANFNLQFHPSAFRVQALENNRNDSSAGVKLRVTPNIPPTGAAPAGNVAEVYTLEAVAYRGTQTQAIEYITQPMAFALMYDQARAQLRRVTNPCLYRFDTYTGQWVSENNWNLTYAGQSVTVNRMGQYTVMNKR